MVKREPVPEGEIPVLTTDQLEQAKKLILASSREPLLPTGTMTACQVCKGEMFTTNNLRHIIPTPAGMVILSRLPGAQCLRCGTKQYDPAALAAILEQSDQEIVADYETRVTHASGSTLGTYFKADLTRVLHLSGKERLRWTILDGNNALVEVER